MALVPNPHAALIPGTEGQIHPYCPQRTEPWMLSAWPEADPECMECMGYNRVQDTHEEAELNYKVLGPPNPTHTDQATLQYDNQRMMRLLADRNIEPAGSPQSPLAITASRRKGFEVFQTAKGGEGQIYAFDLQQAFESVEIHGVDDAQVAALRHRFGLQAGDTLSFRTFDAMCDMLLAGTVPNDPSSPPRAPSEPVPGSPEYVPGKKEKPTKSVPPPKNPVPYYKVMDQKMQVPQKARIQHGFGITGTIRR